MMDNLWIAVVVLVIVCAIVMVVGGRKKRWEKITMADGDVMCVYRTGADYWLRDRQNMTNFHRLNGRYIKLSNHFTLKREEIDESQVVAIEAEVVRLRAKKEEDA